MSCSDNAYKACQVTRLFVMNSSVPWPSIVGKFRQSSSVASEGSADKYEAELPVDFADCLLIICSLCYFVCLLYFLWLLIALLKALIALDCIAGARPLLFIVWRFEFIALWFLMVMIVRCFESLAGAR